VSAYSGAELAGEPLIRQTSNIGKWSVVFACAAFFGAAPQASAHPHVFIEANLEIVRDGAGAVTELRHVWRFDELFSTSVLLDYDTNADNKLETSELDEVSKTVTASIAEYNFYTELRVGSDPVEFSPPERIMVDFQDNQILMFFALKTKAPIETKSGNFKIAVSDASFYVALEIADESAVQILGDGAACTVTIDRPDYDALIARSSQTLTEQFFNDPKNASLGDEWLTWITPQCK
jgi:ABC-type uncharacterized transport system substrate-binding protein